MESKMEDSGRDGSGGSRTHWWWALASSAQLGLGISYVRRGYVGRSYFMPFKAAACGSLFVGSFYCAVTGILRACDIYTVEDMMEMGGYMRTGLGLPSRGTLEDLKEVDADTRTGSGVLQEVVYDE